MSFVLTWELNYISSNIVLISSTLLLLVPGPIAQSVASPTADPGIMSLISAWSHTYVEIGHEIISMFILNLLPLIREGLLSVIRVIVEIRQNSCPFHIL